jgi:uncharacterized SAM-binding protein YcdF (DUF218 family)
MKLIEPLGAVWLALIGYAVWLYRKERKREAAFVGGLAGFIWIVGATPVTALLLASLERPYAGLEFAVIPEADAVVLLGGGSTVSPYEASNMHLSSSGDRVIMAYELMLADRAPVLVIGGGTERVTEILLSENTRDWFANGKLERSKMIALPHCRNTFDEALAVKAVVSTNGWGRILLVTSAAHMRRAAATFRTQNLDIYEVPCNFHTLAGRYGHYSIGIVPDASGFEKFSSYLHESFGWLYYRIRGRISREAARQKTPSFKQ